MIEAIEYLDKIHAPMSVWQNFAEQMLIKIYVTAEEQAAMTYREALALAVERDLTSALEAAASLTD